MFGKCTEALEFTFKVEWLIIFFIFQVSIELFDGVILILDHIVETRIEWLVLLEHSFVDIFFVDGRAVQFGVFALQYKLDG